MQNKPNFLKDQMNVSLNITKDYGNISDWTLGENKPKQTQFQMPTKPPKERKEKKGVRNFFWLSVAGKDIILFMGNRSLA